MTCLASTIGRIQDQDNLGTHLQVRQLNEGK